MEVWQWISGIGGLFEAVLLVMLLEKSVGFKTMSRRITLVTGVVCGGIGNVLFYENFTAYSVYLLIVVAIYCRIALKGTVWHHEGIVLCLVAANGVVRVGTSLGMKWLATACGTAYGTTGYEVAILVVWQKVLCIAILVFLMIRALYGSQRTALENVMLTEQMKRQQANVLKIEADYYKARKLRHDINRSLGIYIRLLEEGRVDEVISTMKSTVGEMPADKVIYLSANNIISAVLNEKMGICRNHEIEFGVQLTAEIDKEREMDIAIMLSNLLDNAIENQLDGRLGAKIFVSIFDQNGMYNVVVKNTTRETVLGKNPQLVTQKSDELYHGIGLKSVKDTVEKYDGIIDFDETRGQFTVHAAIPREE